MRKRHYLLLVILIGFCLMLVALAKWMRPYDLDAEMKAARAEGIPLTPAEFQQPMCPPEQNAAAGYTKLLTLTKQRPVDTEAVEAARTGSSGLSMKAPERTADLRKLLAGRPDVARLVHEIASKPRACYQHKYTVEELFPQFSQMRTCAKWIRWESLLLAREGRYEAAVENEALGFQFARHAAEDPILIGYLVSVACEAITLKGYAEILAEAGPNPLLAEAVHASITKNTVKRDFARSLNAEMVFGLNTMRRVGSLSGLRAITSNDPNWVPPPPTEAKGLTKSLLIKPSEAIYIHWMRSFIAAARTPGLRARNAALSTAQARFEEAPKSRPTYLFAAILIPVLARAGERDADVAAQRQLLSAASTVLAYRGISGRWPASLRAVAAPVEDPLTGGALGYRVDGNGFAVWATPDTKGDQPAAAAKLKERFRFQYPAPPQPKPAAPRGRHWKIPPRPSFPEGAPAGT